MSKPLSLFVILLGIAIIITSCWNNQYMRKFTGENYANKKAYETKYKIKEDEQYEDCLGYSVVRRYNERSFELFLQEYTCLGNGRGKYVSKIKYYKENGEKIDSTIVTIEFKTNPNYIYSKRDTNLPTKRIKNDYPYIADGKAVIENFTSIVPDLDKRIYGLLIPFDMIYIANTEKIQNIDGTYRRNMDLTEPIKSYQLGFEAYKQVGEFKDGVREGVWSIYESCQSIALPSRTVLPCDYITKYNFENGYVEGLVDVYRYNRDSKSYEKQSKSFNYKHSNLDGWFTRPQRKEITPNNEMYMDSILYEDGIETKRIPYILKF